MCMVFTSIKRPANYLFKRNGDRWYKVITDNILTVRNLSTMFWIFFCTLATRRNIVHFKHFNNVPFVLELELCMGLKCTWCFFTMTFVPLLSGHLLSGRGWLLNRGRTVVTWSIDQLMDQSMDHTSPDFLCTCSCAKYQYQWWIAPVFVYTPLGWLHFISISWQRMYFNTELHLQWNYQTEKHYIFCIPYEQ